MKYNMKRDISAYTSECISMNKKIITYVAFLCKEDLVITLVAHRTLTNETIIRRFNWNLNINSMTIFFSYNKSFQYDIKLIILFEKKTFLISNFHGLQKCKMYFKILLYLFVLLIFFFENFVIFIYSVKIEGNLRMILSRQEQ